MMLWLAVVAAVIGGAVFDIIYVATGHRLDSFSSILLLGTLILWVLIAAVWRSAARGKQRP